MMNMHFGMRSFVSCRLACLFLLPAAGICQSPASDSAINAAALKNAVAQYRDYVESSAPLFSGTRYVEYYAHMKEGQPFYLSPEPHKGEVRFDNILYPNLVLKYDLVMNRVILFDSAHGSRITLNPDKIDYFAIEGHRFIKLDKDRKNGLRETDYYEVLYENKGLTLLKKDQRKVIEDSEFKRFIHAEKHYYLQRGGTYYPFNTTGQVLSALADKKSEVRSYIRNNDLFLREDLDTTVQSVLLYYQSLLK